MRSKRHNPHNRRHTAARIRALRAIGSVRRGDSKTLASAARGERTTVATIRRLLPRALAQDRLRTRIRVRDWDPYQERVEIVTDMGPLDVTARGSRQRELAGRHRKVVFQVLRGTEPASALAQFRGKKVGGHELIADFNRLSALAEAGLPEQLDSLYVSPSV